MEFNSAFQLCTEPHNQGFMMSYPNRVTVSIRWGTMSYSDGLTTAEGAAWYCNEDGSTDWIHVPEFDYGYDDVLARMSTVEVTRFMNNAMNLSNPKDHISNIFS